LAAMLRGVFPAGFVFSGEAKISSCLHNGARAITART
jgi:hypothetical protein